MRACVKPGKALGAKVGPDRLQLSTGQGGEGESKTWEEKRSEQPGRPYGSAASYTPCFPIAVRALPTHPIHKPRRRSWGLCSGPRGKCLSECCIQHCLTFSCLPHWDLHLHKRPLFSLFLPWCKGAENQSQFPSASLSCFPLLNLLSYS